MLPHDDTAPTAGERAGLNAPDASAGGPAPRRTAPAVVEPLEQRRLLSIAVGGGGVVLTGTAGNDRFVVRGDPADPEVLHLSDGAETRALARSAVRKLAVAGGEGDDQLVVANDFGLVVGRRGRGMPVSFDGGAGYDRVVFQGDPGVPDLAGRYALGRDANSGVLTTGNRRLSQTVKFNGVEEIADLTPAASLAVSANGRPNAIDIINGPAMDAGATARVNIHNVRAPNGTASGGGGGDRIRLAQEAAFASIRFGNKQHVGVRAMGGGDYINLDAAGGAAGMQSLAIDGAGGRDTLATVGTPASIAAGLQHNGIERVQQQRQFGFNGGGTSSGGGMSSGASNASATGGGTSSGGAPTVATNASSSRGGTATQAPLPPPSSTGAGSSTGATNASSTGGGGSTAMPTRPGTGAGAGAGAGVAGSGSTAGRGSGVGRSPPAPV